MSGRKMISSESFDEGDGIFTEPGFKLLELWAVPGVEADAAGEAAPSTQPWCSALRQPVSKSPLMNGFAVSRTASYALNSGSFNKA